MKKCPYCSEEVKGRSDKIFCTSYCKSLFHYKEALTTEDKLYTKIDRQIKLNRRLLKSYTKAGKAVIRKEKLLEVGFNPNT
jgi:ribulose kinase